MIQENYLQPTGFKLILNKKHYKRAEYFVTSVNHPDVTLPSIETPYRSINTHMSGDRLVFGEVAFEMIVDEDMKNYKEMYELLQNTVQQGEQLRSDRLNTQAPLDFDITLVSLSSHNNANVKIVYKDARLTNLGAVEFRSATTDVQYITVPLTFSFSYFEVN